MAARWWLGAAIAVAMLWAPAARAVVLRASETVGAPGATVEIAVVLDSGGDQVAGIQNDIELSPPLHVGRTGTGRPDCTVNPDIQKNGSGFSLAPCDRGGDCERLRALILALDNVDPIPDGSELYRCRIAIDDNAVSGDYRLLVTNPGASDPDGNALPADGLAGGIVIDGAPGELVRVDDAVVRVGDFTPISVRLTGTIGAATATNDITLSWAVNITRNVDDKPSCTSDLPGVATTFEFLPPGCSTIHDTCTTMRASVTSSTPLPVDVALYRCSVFPVPVIDPGTYVIDCPSATAADASGAPLSTSCQSASIQILPYEDLPTATPTPTGAASPGTPTAIRATPTFTAAVRLTTTPSIGVDRNDDDGCQVAPPARTGAIVPLLGPALLLIRRRRKRL